MSSEARLLVFGMGGWLGQALRMVAGARGVEAYGPPRTEVDVRDRAAVEAALDTHEPTAVLNLAAARPGASEAALIAVNTKGALEVAEACAQRGTRLVHVSTDALLDGREAPYADDAPARPLTPYGASKAAGELAVLASRPTALCVRTSLIWDPTAMDRGTTAFAGRLERGEPCRLFTDEVRCPLPRGVLATALLDLVGLPASGTLNVAGREALSRHDFGAALLQHFDVPGRERVQAVRAADLEREGGPPRPRDLRLVVDRAEALLGYRLPGVSEVLGSSPGV